MATTMDRTEWLKERQTGIGGSDAGAVLGVSPWRTPVDVWLDKTGRATPKEETASMRYGTFFEEYVAQLYAEQTGQRVQRYNKMIHQGCLIGNFDRLVIAPGEKIAALKGDIRTDTLLECKTSGKDWGGEVPLTYQVQVLHYLGLSPALQHADVAVLFRHSLKFEVHRIERDEELISEMQARLTEWWNEYVVGDKMPPPSNEDDCRKLWARSNPGKSITATEEIERDIALYEEATGQANFYSDKADEYKSAICAKMGDAEIITTLAGVPRVSWKSAKDATKTDWEALAHHLWTMVGAEGSAIPQTILEKYTTVKPGSRRFLVKALKSAAA